MVAIAQRMAHRLGWLALVALVSLVAPGCGEDDATTPDTAATTEDAVPDTPVTAADGLAVETLGQDPDAPTPIDTVASDGGEAMDAGTADTGDAGAGCGPCAPGRVCGADGKCVWAPGMLQPIRYFLCKDAQTPAQIALRGVAGAPGDSLRMHQAAGSCQYDLVYRGADGKDQVISAEPGLYLVAQAQVWANGDAVVCAARTAHHRHPKAVAEPSLPPLHLVDGVRIDCTYRKAGVWSPATPVVQPDGEWAAWPKQVEALEGACFRLHYARDFTFQFLNLVNSGRPATDGTWQVDACAAAGKGPVASTSAVQLSAQVVAPGKPEVQQWQPTPDEKLKYAPYMKLDDGACPPPGGCTVTGG